MIDFGDVWVDVRLNTDELDRFIRNGPQGLNQIPDVPLDIRVNADQINRQIQSISGQVDCLTVELCLDKDRLLKEAKEASQEVLKEIQTTVDGINLSTNISTTIDVSNLDVLFKQTIKSFEDSAERIGKTIADEVSKATVRTGGRGLVGGALGAVGSVAAAPFRLAGLPVGLITRGLFEGLGENLTRQLATGLEEAFSRNLLPTEEIGRTIGDIFSVRAKDIVTGLNSGVGSFSSALLEALRDPQGFESLGRTVQEVLTNLQVSEEQVKALPVGLGGIVATYNALLESITIDPTLLGLLDNLSSNFSRLERRVRNAAEGFDQLSGGALTEQIEALNTGINDAADRFALGRAVRRGEQDVTSQKIKEAGGEIINAEFQLRRQQLNETRAALNDELAQILARLPAASEQAQGVTQIAQEEIGRLQGATPELQRDILEQLAPRLEEGIRSRFEAVLLTIDNQLLSLENIDLGPTPTAESGASPEQVAAFRERERGIQEQISRFQERRQQIETTIQQELSPVARSIETGEIDDRAIDIATQAILRFSQGFVNTLTDLNERREEIERQLRGVQLEGSQLRLEGTRFAGPQVRGRALRLEQRSIREQITELQAEAAELKSLVDLVRETPQALISEDITPGITAAIEGVEENQRRLREIENLRKGLERSLEGLSAELESLPDGINTFVRDIVNALSGDIVDPSKIPQLIVDELTLQRIGAVAAFDPESNAVLMSQALADSIVEGTLSRFDLETIIEEIGHSIQSRFGSLQGLEFELEDPQQRRPIQPLGLDATAEEMGRVAQSVNLYNKEVQAIEADAKIAAIRLADTIIAQREIRHTQEKLFEEFGFAGAGFEAQAQQAIGQQQITLANLRQSAEKYGIDFNNQLGSVEEAIEFATTRVNESLEDLRLLATGKTPESSAQQIEDSIRDRQEFIAAIDKKLERLEADLQRRVSRSPALRERAAAGREFISQAEGVGETAVATLGATGLMVEGFAAAGVRGVQQVVGALTPSFSQLEVSAEGVSKGLGAVAPVADFAGKSIQALGNAAFKVADALEVAAFSAVPFGAALRGPTKAVTRAVGLPLAAGAALTATPLLGPLVAPVVAGVSAAITPAISAGFAAVPGAIGGAVSAALPGTLGSLAGGAASAAAAPVAAVGGTLVAGKVATGVTAFGVGRAATGVVKGAGQLISGQAQEIENQVQQLTFSPEKIKEDLLTIQRGFQEPTKRLRELIKEGNVAAARATEETIRASLERARKDLAEGVEQLKASGTNLGSRTESGKLIRSVRLTLDNIDRNLDKRLEEINKIAEVDPDDLTLRAIDPGQVSDEIKALTEKANSTLDDLINNIFKVNGESILDATVQAAKSETGQNLAVSATGAVAGLIGASQGPVASAGADLIATLLARQTITAGQGQGLGAGIGQLQATLNDPNTQARLGKEVFEDIVGFILGNLASLSNIPGAGAATAAFTVPSISSFRESLAGQTGLEEEDLLKLNREISNNSAEIEAILRQFQEIQERILENLNRQNRIRQEVLRSEEETTRQLDREEDFAALEAGQTEQVRAQRFQERVREQDLSQFLSAQPGNELLSRVAPPGNQEETIGFFERLRGSVDEIRERFPILNNFIGILRDVGVSVAALVGAFSIGDVIVEQVRAAVTALSELQTVTLRLNFGAGGAAQGAQALEDITNRAADLSLNLRDTRDAYAQFIAGTRETFGLELATQTFEGITTALAATQPSAEVAQRALVGFQQTAQSGVLSLEELRQQIAESGAIPGFLSILADTLGIAEGELKELVSTGTVLAVDTLPALSRNLEILFGESVKAASETIVAAQNRISNSILLIQESLGLAAEPVIIDTLDAVSQGLDFVADNLQIVSSIAIGALLPVLISIVKIASGPLLAALRSLSASVIFLSGGLQNLGNAFLTTTVAAGKFAVIALGITTVIAAYQDVAETVDDATSSITSANETLIQSFDFLSKNIEKDSDRILDAIDKINKARPQGGQGFERFIFGDARTQIEQELRESGISGISPQEFNELVRERQNRQLQARQQQIETNRLIGTSRRLQPLREQTVEQARNQAAEVTRFDQEIFRRRQRLANLSGGEAVTAEEELNRLLGERADLIDKVTSVQQNAQAQQRSLDAALNQAVERGLLSPEQESALRDQTGEARNFVGELNDIFDEVLTPDVKIAQSKEEFDRQLSELELVAQQKSLEINQALLSGFDPEAVQQRLAETAIEASQTQIELSQRFVNQQRELLEGPGGDRLEAQVRRGIEDQIRETESTILSAEQEILDKTLELRSLSNERELRQIEEAQQDRIRLVERGQAELELLLQEGIRDRTVNQREAENIQFNLEQEAFAQRIAAAEQNAQELREARETQVLNPQEARDLEQQILDIEDETNQLRLDRLTAFNQERTRLIDQYAQDAVDAQQRILLAAENTSNTQIQLLNNTSAALDQQINALERQERLLQGTSDLIAAQNDRQAQALDIRLASLDRAEDIINTLNDPESSLSLRERLDLRRDLRDTVGRGEADLAALDRRRNELLREQANIQITALENELSLAEQLLEIELQRNRLTQERAVTQARIAQQEAAIGVRRAEIGEREAQIELQRLQQQNALPQEIQLQELRLEAARLESGVARDELGLRGGILRDEQLALQDLTGIEAQSRQLSRIRASTQIEALEAEIADRLPRRARRGLSSRAAQLQERFGTRDEDLIDVQLRRDPNRSIDAQQNRASASDRLLSEALSSGFGGLEDTIRSSSGESTSTLTEALNTGFAGVQQAIQTTGSPRIVVNVPSQPNPRQPGSRPADLLSTMRRS